MTKPVPTYPTSYLWVAHEDLKSDTYHEWMLNGLAKAGVNGVGKCNMREAAWVELICNNPKCHARGIVHKSRLATSLDQAQALVDEARSEPFGIDEFY